MLDLNESLNFQKRKEFEICCRCVDNVFSTNTAGAERQETPLDQFENTKGQSVAVLSSFN
jgi:hypothetical protein